MELMYCKTVLLTLIMAVSGNNPALAAVHLPATGSDLNVQHLSVQDFLRTPNRDMSILLGEDLNWKQKWALRIVKRKLKKLIKKKPELATYNLSELILEPYLLQPFQTSYQDPAVDKVTNGFAIGSFILGIVSVISISTILGSIIAGLLAVILGIVSLTQIRRHKEKFKGRGWAILGIILGGSIMIFFGVLIATFGA